MLTLPGTVLGVEDTRVNKTGKNFRPCRTYVFNGGDSKLNKYVVWHVRR